MNGADYEAWRLALIAFHEAESPYMTQTLANLRAGLPLTEENKRTVRAIIAAMDALQPSLELEAA